MTHYARRVRASAPTTLPFPKTPTTALLLTPIWACSASLRALRSFWLTGSVKIRQDGCKEPLATPGAGRTASLVCLITLRRMVNVVLLTWMGVGRLETMEGKSMAIDSSIWIYQFQATMRDKEGRGLVNAHVLGFLRRICKLLFYGIKPVFVFDGGAPALKMSTIVSKSCLYGIKLEFHGHRGRQNARTRRAGLRPVMRRSPSDYWRRTCVVRLWSMPPERRRLNR